MKKLDSIEVGLFKGKLTDINNIKADKLDVAEMARTLQRIPRYNCHSDFEWTVGQHSLLVAKILEDKGQSLEVQLAGLLHDASEAYINDVIRPIKVYLKEYFKYENRVEDAILSKFGLKGLETYAYREADNLALYAESAKLIGLNNDWVKTYPKEFDSPDVMEYQRFVKDSNSSIVMGEFLQKLYELLEQLEFKGVDDNIKQQDWFNIAAQNHTLNKINSIMSIKRLPIMLNDGQIDTIVVDYRTRKVMINLGNENYQTSLSLLNNIKDLEIILKNSHDSHKEIFNILFRKT